MWWWRLDVEYRLRSVTARQRVRIRGTTMWDLRDGRLLTIVRGPPSYPAEDEANPFFCFIPPPGEFARPTWETVIPEKGD